MGRNDLKSYFRKMSLVSFKNGREKYVNTRNKRSDFWSNFKNDHKNHLRQAIY